MWRMTGSSSTSKQCVWQVKKRQELQQRVAACTMLEFSLVGLFLFVSLSSSIQNLTCFVLVLMVNRIEEHSQLMLCFSIY